MTRSISRRNILAGGAALAGGLAACKKTTEPTVAGEQPGAAARTSANEEYVWISANANLPLFVTYDHPALYKVGKELGVKVTIAGPSTVDIPGLVAAVEQTIARRPTGIMVVGWEPSALIASINQAVDSGIPVVCVDGDVPGSKRLSFIGTDWREIGILQGQQMLKALNGRKGRVAMLGLIEQYIDQIAFEGFRSVVSPAGLQLMEPMQDKGNQGEAARVASALLQAHADLVGMAGFDSESGAGMCRAIKESGKTGTIVATCVDREPQQIKMIQEGVLTAAIGQKRALFTYHGVKALYDIVHSGIHFSADDRKLGISPVPVFYNTGTFVVTRENVDTFLKNQAA